MVRYSQYINQEATDVNDKAVVNNTANSFTETPPSTNITQLAVNNATQSGTNYVTHSADNSRQRISGACKLVGDYYEPAIIGVDCDIDYLGETQTKITKLSSGTQNLKINIIV